VQGSRHNLNCTGRKKGGGEGGGEGLGACSFLVMGLAPISSYVQVLFFTCDFTKDHFTRSEKHHVLEK
jgi:hypothetical protein